MTLPADRRRWPRVATLLPCVYYPAMGIRQTMVLNLSMGGALICSHLPRARGQQVCLSFPAESGFRLLEAPASVVHVTQRSRDLWIVGVEWSDWAGWVPESLSDWLHAQLEGQLFRA